MYYIHIEIHTYVCIYMYIRMFKLTFERMRASVCVCAYCKYIFIYRNILYGNFRGVFVWASDDNVMHMLGKKDCRGLLSLMRVSFNL